jgi:hypothetical protein
MSNQQCNRAVPLRFYTNMQEATAKAADVAQGIQQNRMAAAASSHTHDQAVPLRMYTNMGEATAKAADVVQEIEQNRMAAAASSHTQETVTSETETQLVMVEGAVPDLDLLTLQQQALDAVAAAPEVRGLLLKILNLPKAQQMVISSALNLHQPTVTPTPWTPTRGHGVEEEGEELCRIAMDGGCENYNGPHIEFTTEHEITGTKAWFYVLKCQRCGVMAVTAAGVGSGPVKWAMQKGWSTPSNGNRRWKRCQCPKHPFQ